ncbi:heat stress transcription factor B-4-like protein [Tanacetum coccineum]|uniref:Heat stress transcription factor B-4-like protein n=1 Tax=Tanacetum coccineum TaxID=301880 RepID=A0ABQ4XPG9_9ASTR
MYVSGRVDIFDMVDVDLFTIVALNMMVLKLGYTGKSELMFYNYLRPLTSLDKGLYVMACEEDVRCLTTLVRSFKLIEVYIEHGVIALDSYLRAPRETTKEPVCDSVTPSSLPQHHSKLDGKASFADVAESGLDSSGLSHDESFGVDDLDLNLNEPVNLNVSQVETQSELPVSEEPDVVELSSGLSHDESFGVDDLDLNLNEPEPILTEVSTQEPIVVEVSTQEPIVAEVSTQVPIVEEVGTQEFSVEDVVLKDYVSSGEDAEQYNGKFDESAPSTDDDDDVDEDFLVDEENKIVEPDVDIHLFGISMDLSFDNISVTNLVPDDVLKGEDVDVINEDGFDSDPGNDKETNYKKRWLAELRTEMEGVINASGQWKYSFYTSQKFTTPKEAKDKGIRPTGPNRGMEVGPSGSSGPTNRSKKKEEYREIKHCTYKFLFEKIFEQVKVNLNIPVKAVQDQLQRELEVQISMSKAICLGALKLGFRACIRDLLGLDGAFMKGPFPGQVLVAVGLDSNNGIYPLAYALVEAESKSSWCWFLQCLGDDIDLHPNSNFTFISDRQKGIIPAIKNVYTNVEHRYCLRHIHENMKQGWCGQAYKDLLWRAASATNVRDFEKCRAKSDLLLNNICEVFNGVIDKCTGPLTHTAIRIMESIKKEAHLIKVQWIGANKYQVSGSLGDQCVVDVVDRPRKKRKRSKHEDEPFVKDGKLNLRFRDVKRDVKRFFTKDEVIVLLIVLGILFSSVYGGNNAEGSGSASRQAQQIEPAVGQDGLGGLGAGAVIGLSAVAGEGGAGDTGGAGVASQDGREMGDGVPTQSSAAGGASEWTPKSTSVATV